MNALIIKLGASGDVVRTTPLLKRLNGHVTWLTASENRVLLHGLNEDLRCFVWKQRDLVRDLKYDLVINLEDSLETALFLKTVEFRQLFGAYVNSENKLCYTEDSRGWFDLGLISIYGRQQADKLKCDNRRTYQELIFTGLGFVFDGETYLLPKPMETDLMGDVAIASDAGPGWPMKNWAFYDALERELETRGLTVNVLRRRASILEHISDVRNHRCLVSGDSLPMHVALGAKTKCITLFTCTSPWEIEDYGVQRKIVSPLLDLFFYHRGNDCRGTTAITVDEVLTAVVTELEPSGADRLVANTKF